MCQSRSRLDMYRAHTTYVPRPKVLVALDGSVWACVDMRHRKPFPRVQSKVTRLDKTIAPKKPIQTLAPERPPTDNKQAYDLIVSVTPEGGLADKKSNAVRR